MSLSNLSSIETLLLLSEWPMLPVLRAKWHESDSDESEETGLLKPSLRYDAY
jgi:hypothetical protein